MQRRDGGQKQNATDLRDHQSYVQEGRPIVEKVAGWGASYLNDAGQ